MRTSALMCILLAFATAPSTSQNEPVGMSGVVLKADGKPMAGAFVVVRDFLTFNIAVKSTFLTDGKVVQRQMGVFRSPCREVVTTFSFRLTFGSCPSLSDCVFSPSDQ
jgi:hypothetical protein